MRWFAQSKSKRKHQQAKPYFASEALFGGDLRRLIPIVGAELEFVVGIAG